MRASEEIKKEILSLNYKTQKDIPLTLWNEYHRAMEKEIDDYEYDIRQRCEITEGIPLDKLREICNLEKGQIYVKMGN